MTTDFADNDKSDRRIAHFCLVERRSLEASFGCRRMNRHQSPVLLVKRSGSLVGQFRQFGDFRLSHHMGGVKVIGGGAAMNGTENVDHRKSL